MNVNLVQEHGVLVKFATNVRSDSARHPVHFGHFSPHNVLYKKHPFAIFSCRTSGARVTVPFFGVFLVVPVQICVYVLLRAKLAADEHVEADKVYPHHLLHNQLRANELSQQTARLT